ncbi:MAG: hypothetical protein GWO20_19180 [Candidatus Korarchaeota archaeon]|nr:hypothetical protein [Candidatus Korarchaeota archaeon]NIU85380.1 hypothetical protein [Candidatus Thorarchaeota archaeon]NIW15478.1 hypothetical protein [Candidatus Thorarchaeota archaeon]NIW53422.1 hypothetical protein [Candidatus Korarchaeota archaeon]
MNAKRGLKVKNFIMAFTVYYNRLHNPEILKLPLNLLKPRGEVILELTVLF